MNKNTIFDMTGFEEISNAIVLQAVHDYRTITINKKKESNTCNIKEIEKFFRSKWFKTLTNIDPEFLINELRKEANEKINTKLKKAI